MNSNIEKNERNYCYDILRIMACLGIVCVHEVYLPKPQIISEIFQLGAGGVQVFFVMSGWWAAIAFSKENIGITEYYKKRFLKIIPAYYLSVACMMAFQVFVGTNPVDEWGLGYFRYFLALNTVLPSNDYHFWNNLFGLWTMGDFIWFYIFAPFLLRKGNYRKSCILFFLSLILKGVTGEVYSLLFGGIGTIDSLEVLSGASLFGVLMHFIMGVMCYHSLNENKKEKMYVICSLVLLIAIFRDKSLLIWDVIAVLLLYASHDNAISVQSKKARYIKVLSGQSYHVYLFHALAMETAMTILRNTTMSPGSLYYVLWAIMAVFFVVILCITATWLEGIIRTIIQVKKIGIYKET